MFGIRAFLLHRPFVPGGGGERLSACAGCVAQAHLKAKNSGNDRLPVFQPAYEFSER